MEPPQDALCCWCGAAPCDWEIYEEELWLATGRMLPKLQRRKHQNRVLRQTLGRIYLQEGGQSLWRCSSMCQRNSNNSGQTRQERSLVALLTLCISPPALLSVEAA
ncbi:hypothetical protein PI124_g21563 [Phytophthora idaei]|nr:hypothetical protein PI125_g16179 [Phytophthora idaei]KAG3128594.1 hypothetical protein PI126_g21339 [Phytophthora idaei]KAG3233365.1 hypothetical protein PI124_g21563 [Phytophthora idaei]